MLGQFYKIHFLNIAIIAEISDYIIKFVKLSQEFSQDDVALKKIPNKKEVLQKELCDVRRINVKLVITSFCPMLLVTVLIAPRFISAV